MSNAGLLYSAVLRQLTAATGGTVEETPFPLSRSTSNPFPLSRSTSNQGSRRSSIMPLLLSPGKAAELLDATRRVLEALTEMEEAMQTAGTYEACYNVFWRLSSAFSLTRCHPLSPVVTQVFA